jgi:hypothetical protein
MGENRFILKLLQANNEGVMQEGDRSEVRAILARTSVHSTKADETNQSWVWRFVCTVEIG